MTTIRPAANLPMCIVAFAGGVTQLLVLLFVGLAVIIVVWGLALLLPATRWGAMRLALALPAAMFYRFRVVGRGNLPAGGSLIVCNHTSWIDVLVLMHAARRPIRFLMQQELYDHWFFGPFARVAGAIPISSQLGPRQMIESLRSAGAAIEAGETVCIFAEGEITRIGRLLPFRRGAERIMKDVSAPIVPAHLDRLWGSIFSYEGGRFLWKLPRSLPYRITVSFGTPLAHDASPEAIREQVQALATDAFAFRRDRMLPLHRAFIRSARREPWRFAMADGMTPRVRFGSALVRTVFLAHRLRAVWRKQERVAILLPPSVAGALVNIAAAVMGKTAVNLNYTASAAVLEQCLAQCGITRVLTSHAFLEKAPLSLKAEMVLLEEVAMNPRGREKWRALLMAWLLPARSLERRLRDGDEPAASVANELDRLATIIFSSGSTAAPKGVMLSHYNIAANLEQLTQVFPLERSDRFMGILPLFHAFGYTGTFWLPLTLGLGVVFHPSPLDARAIGALVGRYRATFLVATPTFLQTYTRRCGAEDFGSLRFVQAGAERLADHVAQAFEEKFGVRPMEGYGATECAPVIAVSAPSFRDAGFHQVGSRRGAVGHPLPGISVQVRDAASGETAALGGPGVLSVRGPNVMQGYLSMPEKTAEVLRDGWYNTGDIVALDEEGFITIAGRLTRFSKIGGEMVPHIRIEEKLNEFARAAEQALAVTAVEDEKRGERIIVLHTLPDEQLAEVLARVGESDLPALWRPRAQNFYRVEAIPFLGTGKLDLVSIRKLALQLSAESKTGAAT